MRKLIFMMCLIQMTWATTPKLVVLAPQMQGVSDSESKIIYQSLLMVLNQNQHFDIPSSDDIHYQYRQMGYMKAPICFDDRCLIESGKLLKSDLILGVFGGKSGTRTRFEFRLIGVNEQAALWEHSFEFQLNRLNQYPEAFQDINAKLIGYDTQLTTQPLKKIATDFKTPYVLSLISGSALSAWLLYEYGPWISQNKNRDPIDKDFIKTHDEALSGIRGFYASRPGGGRYRAMGGAGVSLVDDAFSPIWNPAGLAKVSSQQMQFSREVLPTQVPKQIIAYAAPLSRNLYHAQTLQYEGDALAKEMIFYSSYASDLSLFSAYFNQVQAGVNLKGMLVEIGNECTGIDCSQGGGYGFGLDFGLQWSIQSVISFGFVIQDPFSFMRYSNFLTGRQYTEDIPPILLGGVSYEFTQDFLAQVDIKKGLYADQKDRISIGLEKQVVGFIWLRGGLYQLIDHNDFKLWTLGFGLNQDYEGYMFKVNYHFEYGNQEAVLFQAQQSFDFSLQF